MTLKPSKRNTKTTKQKKQKRQKKRKNKKKPKNTQKWAFQLSVKIFLFFWVGVQNFPFLTTWPKKRAPKKHYKNRGFSNFFLETHMRHETAIFGPKKPKFINSSYHFFCLFSTENTKNAETLFYSVLASPKRDFQILYLKHWKLKNPIFAPFFWKRLLLENCQIIGHKKTQNDNWVCKPNLLKPLFL